MLGYAVSLVQFHDTCIIIMTVDLRTRITHTYPKDRDKASVTTLISSVTAVDRYKGTKISQMMQVV